MTNKLISGPHTRSRGEALGSVPGSFVIVRGDEGPILLKRPLSRGEMRFGHYQDYYLISSRSDEQTVEFTTRAQDPRDEFKVAVVFEVEVVNPIKLFTQYGTDRDPLGPIRQLVIHRAGLEATEYDRQETGALASAIEQLAVHDEFDFAEVRFRNIRVDLTDESLKRRDRDAATSDKRDVLTDELDMARLKKEHEHELELLRLNSEHELATEQFRFRKERIRLLADDLDLHLDPLMLQALAADGAPSQEVLTTIRAQLRDEHHENAQRFAEFVIALNDAKVLDNKRHAAVMEFLNSILTSAAASGAMPLPARAVPDIRELTAPSSEEELDDQREAREEPTESQRGTD